MQDNEYIRVSQIFMVIDWAINETRDKGVIYGLEKAKSQIRNCCTGVQLWQVKQILEERERKRTEAIENGDPDAWRYL